MMGSLFRTRGLLAWTAVLAALFCSARTGARVLDDYSAGKVGWEDFSFVDALPKPQVDGGQFKFVLPPAGQSLFIASTKKSETFELKEGRTLEFRTDLVQGGGKDSFAILAFIPTSTGAQTLGGYGLAKSTTDVLITKGIGNYFYNENPPSPVKNENVTLSLTMTAQDGNVTVTARVLDKANNDAVLFEKIVVDTPAADVMADGKDEPAAPYITQGNFVLYLYEDFDAGAPEDPYMVTFDNSEVFITDRAVLDDFNGTKESWEDFSFVAALPKPQVDGGQFKFALPPAGQSLFIASTKKSKTYELKEGERLQFDVDLVSAGGKDSFGIVAFIPTSTGAQTLAGYGLAKSSTDVLITKGIGNYFYNENPPTPVKNEKVRLSLNMTARNGNVTVIARILDLENNNAVLFEKIVVDTPAADVLADGKDEPPGPWITQGNFVLYLYEDFDAGAPEDPYQVVYDNAVVHAAPVVGNEPPIISDAVPISAGNFLAAASVISFNAADDKPIADESLAIVLNGTTYTKANGLGIGGTGTKRSATLAGKLEPNVDYLAVLRVTDSDGVIREQTLKFDTFATSNFVIEAEDYNFAGGQYLNNPDPISEGASGANNYSGQEGSRDVDYSETRGGPNGEDTKYRPADPVRMGRTLDKARKKFVDAGGSASEVYDYDVGDLAAGEWMQYTRDFTAGTYEVYLREQVVNVPAADSVLERVTGDPTQANAAATLLGTFLGKNGGFDYLNVPLTDGSGAKKTILRLNGKTTLRLRQLTADGNGGYRLLNYLIFVPVADPGVQRAAIVASSPAPNTTVESLDPTISLTLQNRDTTVNVGTIQLRVNGTVVSGATVTPTADGATVSYKIAPLPPSGSVVTANVTFKDSDGQDISNTWQFTLAYRSLDPATRVSGNGKTRGFKIHVVQAPQDLSPLENSLDRAETQLGANSSIARVVDTNTVVDVVNFDKRVGESAGHVEGDLMVPGIDPDTTGSGDADFAVEILTYLELPAGRHRFGLTTDDGYKLQTGLAPISASTTPIAFHNGGPADETVDFVVTEAGLYPFRMVWYERAGAGFAEWTDARSTEPYVLINDSATPTAIKAWAEVTIVAPEVVVESATSVTGPYTADASAVVSATAKTATVTTAGGAKFFRVRAGSALTLKNLTIQSGQLTFGW